MKNGYRRALNSAHVEYYEFSCILKRYLNGDESKAERLFVEKWYRNIQVRRYQNDEIKDDQLATRMWSRILKSIDPEKTG